MDTLTQEYLNKIPKLGFGLMRLPCFGAYDKIDEAQFAEMADYYMANGMNYFDTAYMYHNGASELATKKAVTERFPRESYYLVDKFPVWSAKTPDDVEKIFNEQLWKCGVSYFDFYMLHSLNAKNNEKNVKLGAYEFFKRMKTEGKIRHFGFSFHGTLEDLRNILTSHPEHDFVQLQINYIDWHAREGKALYDIAREFNKPIIIMEPILGGTLANLPPSVARILSAANPSASQASWALRWCASLPGVITTLSGMSNMAHMKDNVSYMKDFQPLSESELQVVEQAAKALQEIEQIPCTGCKYCLQYCPQSIPIDEVFATYNKYLQTKTLQEFGQTAISVHGVAKTAATCIDCEKCSRFCPQSIQIPKKLAEVAVLAR
ncbi:MAG: aldo/keto reductase [Defluviitaleaceae bacterium]|nr:aldo/keto reductase [Defluviitaleaceae bacterium]